MRAFKQILNKDRARTDELNREGSANFRLVMKKIQEILISTRTMAVLLLVYAAAMGYATFIENDYGTPTAKALVYEAKWFELVMLLLILNFIGNIKRYRLWQRENGRYLFSTFRLFYYSLVVRSRAIFLLKGSCISAKEKLPMKLLPISISLKFRLKKKEIS